MAKAKKATKNNFSNSTYITWYESMLMMRKFEEKTGQLYGQQKIKGFCHLYIGQEACVAGAISALEEEDKYITAYRCHAHALGLGTDPNKIMAEMYGKATGISKGKGGSMHIFDKEHHFYGGHGIVGGQIPLGAGIAFAEMYKNTGKLCIAYMGDGAVRQGAFHEALNMAMTMKMPVIFVIENNGYAMGTSVERTSNVTSLEKLASAYEMPSKSVDGMSVEAIHHAVSEAADRARKGEGPTLLEFMTYRYKGHSMSDPAKYRTKEELEAYKQKDPIEIVRKRILDEKILTEKDLSVIGEKIKEKIALAVSYAEESDYPDASEAYQDVYAQSDYPYLIDG